MTQRELFKVGFLAACAEEGLSPAEAAERARQGLEKAALIGSALSSLSRLTGSVGPLALAGAAAVPVAGGAALGHGLARLQEPGADVEEAKADELVDEYRRQAERIRRRQAFRSLAQSAAARASSSFQR